MLVLFDIDMTMITTGGSGKKAMVDAGSDLFGPGFTAEGIEFSGRLDPLILGDLLRANGLPSTPDQSWRRFVPRHRQKSAQPEVVSLLTHTTGFPGLVTISICCNQ